MWRNSESTVKPLEIEFDYNCNIVWVRRNFVEINTEAETDDNGDVIREARQGWSYEENKIPMNDWETYEQVMKHTESIADIETAVVETAEMSANNEVSLADLESAVMELAEMINGGAE